MLPTIEPKNDKVFLTFKTSSENFTRIRADRISSYSAAYSITEGRSFIEVVVDSVKTKLYFATKERRDDAIKLIELHTYTN